jgi:hypothetical protein
MRSHHNLVQIIRFQNKFLFKFKIWVELILPFLEVLFLIVHWSDNVWLPNILGVLASKNQRLLATSWQTDNSILVFSLNDDLHFFIRCTSSLYLSNWHLKKYRNCNTKKTLFRLFFKTFLCFSFLFNSYI